MGARFETLDARFAARDGNGLWFAYSSKPIWHPFTQSWVAPSERFGPWSIDPVPGYENTPAKDTHIDKEIGHGSDDI